LGDWKVAGDGEEPEEELKAVARATVFADCVVVKDAEENACADERDVKHVSP